MHSFWSVGLHLTSTGYNCDFLSTQDITTISKGITSGSSGLTSPPPSTSPTPTTLTVSAMLVGQPPNIETELQGTLRTDTGPVVGATITFTAVAPDGNTIPVATIPSPVVTDNVGSYRTFTTVPLEAGSTITAHYAGISISLAASSGSSTVF